MPARPLILHVLFRFATGGLENGVVNLVNRMDPARFRHAIVALQDIDPGFASRLRRDGVSLHALHKPPGHGWRLYRRFAALLRELQPAIVHTRNLAALEMQLPSAWTRVPVRLHGEHGRDVDDLDGSDRSLQLVRRLHAPLVHRFTTVSQDLARYLVGKVGVAPARITQIYNGVDTDRFRPRAGPGAIPGCPFDPSTYRLVGTVGRMQEVKHQTLLAQAFVRMVRQRPELRDRVRLVMVGDGPLRAQVAQLLADAGMSGLAWLPGERSDVHELMRMLDVFVLPSLAEGISNTILEAMATGLPVVATDVGGNAELVLPGLTGDLVPSDDAGALATSLLRRIDDQGGTEAMGRQARQTALERFSLGAMVAAYESVYADELERRTGRRH